MLVSCILKSWNRFQWRYCRCFLSSNLSSEKEMENFKLSNSSSSSDATTDEKNQWLWAYLRSEKSFSDLSDEQKRRVIELELQTLRQSGERVPARIPDERWTELLNISSIDSRKNLYEYLFLREMYRKRREIIVAENTRRRLESVQRREELLSQGKQPSNYPGYSSIFRHFTRQQEKHLREQLLIPSARLGECIVIDCGFEHEHAREYHLLNLVDQVQYLFSELHRYHSPSFLYLCNLASHGKLRAEFNRRTPVENLCLEATESSYLDLFPRDKLIYLSPDSNIEMTSFDHDAIYIIGGIIDVTGKKPLTINKAQRENLRHQRFPIDRYVKFGGGSGKTLTLDQVYNILMTMKHCGSWIEAFKYIPNRKVVERYTNKLEEKESDYDKYGQWTCMTRKS